MNPTAVNVFARVTSPAVVDRRPVLAAVDCPAVYDKDPLRAARLADELTWALERLESACVRARDTDTNRAWAWVMAHAVNAKRIEVAYLVACGELPLADGVMS